MKYVLKMISLSLMTLGLGCSASSDDGSHQVRGSNTSTLPPSLTAGTTGSAAGSGNLNADNGGLIGSTAGTSAAIGGSGAVGGDPSVCASASVRAKHVTPTVEFVVDGSGSMESKFGDGTRWSVLRDVLVGAKGVIPTLETSVKFGMTIFSNSDPMTCPNTTAVAPALMNATMINTAFPNMEPGGGTPTGEALQKVIDSLPDYSAMLDSTESAPIVILATDGEPNGCSNAGTCNWAADWASCLGNVLSQVAAAPATYDTTFAAVRKAKDKKIPVWVISMADGLNSIPDLQTTANIGAGLADDAMPGAPIYSPTNADELTSTLTKLLGDTVLCNVELSGTLDVTRACEGTVTMNSAPLTCNDPQGWKPFDATHIVLQGDACTKFKSDPSVELIAKFPCDVIRPD